ncbi:MAG: diacylglycerol kinase [Puniceicoccales bacterium]|jgi:diacylglycerol kinase (ATP)|nr:diacylglycerol kinase [Puniceicoccales bacterium]
MNESKSDFGAQMKSKSGLRRIWLAFTYSRDGLAEAVRHEHAFRQELFVIVPMLGVAVALPVGWRDTALLCASLLGVLIVELLNSAVESCIDYISLERHPLAKRAKDMGSAAVGLSIVVAGLVWAAVLFEKWHG